MFVIDEDYTEICYIVLKIEMNNSSQVTNGFCGLSDCDSVSALGFHEVSLRKSQAIF